MDRPADKKSGQGTDNAVELTIRRLEARAGEHACGGFLATTEPLQRTELFTALIFDRLQRKIRTVEALYAAGPVDPAVREKLRAFVESCVATEILTDEGKMTALTKAPSLSDLLLSGTWVNPARRVFLDGNLYSCKAAAGVVKEALETDLEKVEEKLLLRLSGSSYPMLQEAVRKATAESEAIFLGTAKEENR